MCLTSFYTGIMYNGSYLCDLLLYSLQLGRAFLPHGLRLLHRLQFLTVFNADAQAQSHTHQRAQQFHRCQRAGVSEGSYIRVGQLSEQ